MTETKETERKGAVARGTERRQKGQNDGGRRETEKKKTFEIHPIPFPNLHLPSFLPSHHLVNESSLKANQPLTAEQIKDTTESR